MRETVNLFRYHTNPESLFGYAELSAAEYQVPGTFNGKTYFVANKMFGESKSGWKEAVEFCKNLKMGGHHWFLPNKEELNFIYENLAADGKLLFAYGTHPEKFVATYYWSSSEPNVDGAWLQSMPNGNQDDKHKTLPCMVRAVRSE